MLGPGKKAEGVAVMTAPYGEMTRLKTYTCGHCQFIGFVEPEAAIACGVILVGKGVPEFCMRCSSLICPRCHKKGTCTPWEKQLEALEAKVHHGHRGFWRRG